MTRSFVALVTDVDWEGLDIEKDALDSLGCDLVVAPDTSESTLGRLAAEADIILVCFAALPTSVIEKATSARAIIRWGGGTNNIDLIAAKARGIPVFNVPDFCVDEVADHALMLILALSRGLERQLSTTRSGGWSLPGDLPPRLSNQTLGLVGMGRTGQALARRAQALGMAVKYTMSSRDVPSDITATLVRDLPTLASEVDFLSLHVPLTPETRHLVNTSVFRAMKPYASLINVARGGLVDTDALVDALESGLIQGAGIDVTEPEPLPSDHPLRSHPQCFITPHFAYRSQESLLEVRERVARAASDILGGVHPRPGDVRLVE